MSKYTATVTAMGLLLSTAVASMACDECKSPFKPGKHIGQTRIVGNGSAYSWVVLDARGKPTSVGVTLTESALEGLPTTLPTDMPGYAYDLTLPPQAVKTHIDHVGLDWNPLGHPPTNIYDKPHFDVHFYMITPEEREKITLKGADLARCTKPVLASYMAPGYINPPGSAVPMMGNHWIDAQTPELNGKPFTKTFLFGSYNGNMIFWEPMLTKAYLESRPDETEAIKQPAAFAKSAYYPTRYTVRYDSVRHEYTIALEGMTWRVATAPKPQSLRAAAK